MSPTAPRQVSRGTVHGPPGFILCSSQIIPLKIYPVKQSYVANHIMPRQQVLKLQIGVFMGLVISNKTMKQAQKLSFSGFFLCILLEYVEFAANLVQKCAIHTKKFAYNNYHQLRYNINLQSVAAKLLQFKFFFLICNFSLCIYMEFSNWTQNNKTLKTSIKEYPQIYQYLPSNAKIYNKLCKTFVFLCAQIY
eukprot:TRINITY_DN2787_c1_g1_i16.p3 TRINITY_DN2787_c1_g1~~TRINITY_DN2787_c1_g1_i16.p3  ORF type:complete len:193 (+),score=0.58 TRINITY_DN2787_c1_g1_i16:212-790(+)